ncbi:pilus assembly protein TadG-related protein [Caballeronia sp. SEWSISQ10-4 2]|uniref:TadG family pilus assembly protein n=1 Tax=Caballeronia sp. SEWSISQ10-4 2 TaxID=2937438 RepID=UPI00264CFE7B|nr:TadG family pilus assembly protein [Caballeronia sp. SEWSISQ10-4 2]MDN7183082.1 pilus assembly protein TadG-related protein [Caballeronia sp. SEWSISQ10-4 2]
MRSKRNRIQAPSRQRGVVAVMTALCLVVLIGFAALAIDLGRAWVVRNELQNAADVAALAGAGALGPNYAKPNWTQADAKAQSAISLNATEGTMLTTGTVQSGYWNVTGSPAGLQLPGITPGTYDKPAVQVTVSRSAGQNGGPLTLLLAPVIGITTLPISATAVAVISAPGYAAKGSLFPTAITQCLYSAYWNSATGQPLNDPATGQPKEFKIGTSYQYPGCATGLWGGQWTSFQLNVQDVPSIRDLIANGNPTPLSIGDTTWIQSGVKNSIYNNVPVPADVLLPVVTSLNTGSAVPIVGFAPFHIDGAVNGSNPYISGHFIAGYKAPGASGGGGAGTYYGAVTAASLAQ